MGNSRLLQVSLLALLSLSPAATRAAPPAAAPGGGNTVAETNKNDLLVVISGGISRGSYQAGQMYVFNHWLREINSTPCDNDKTKPNRAANAWCGHGVVYAGSSAGSINALLSSLEASLPASGFKAGEAWPLPEDDLSFRVWIPMGFGTDPASLDHIEADYPTRAERQAYQALINRQQLDRVIQGIEEDVTHRDWSKGEQTPQTLPAVRLVTTAARQVPVSDDNMTQEVTLAFGYELGPTKPAEAAPPRTPTFPIAYARKRAPAIDAPSQTTAASATTGAPRDTEGPVPFDLVADLAVASGTIPGALPLYPLSCADFNRVRSDDSIACNTANGEQVLWLMDGGFLENNPLRVAWDLMAPDVPTSKSRPEFLFLDPDLTKAPPSQPEHQEHMWDRYLQTFTNSGGAGNIISAARNQSLTLYLKSFNGTNGAPEAWTASDSFVYVETTPYANFMGGFLAFYDRSFRVWDFYAGMEDAFRWLEDHGEGDLRARIPSASLYSDVIGYALHPEQYLDADVSQDFPSRWPNVAPQIETLQNVAALRPLGAIGQAQATSQDPDDPAMQLWENLLVLSNLSTPSRRAALEGRAWDMDELTARLNACVVVPDSTKKPLHQGAVPWFECPTLSDSTARTPGRGYAHFVPTDLIGHGGPLELTGENFRDLMRRHLDWQLRQITRRRVIDAKGVENIGRLMRQALFRVRRSWYLGVSGPLLQESIVTGTAGVLTESRTPNERVGVQLRAGLMLERPFKQTARVGDLQLPTGTTGPSGPADQAFAWATAAAADLSLGLDFGLGTATRNPSVPLVGSRFTLRAGPDVYFQPTLATFSSTGEPELWRKVTPTWNWYDAMVPTAVSLQSGLGGHLEVGSLIRLQGAWLWPMVPSTDDTCCAKGHGYFTGSATLLLPPYRRR